MEIAAAAPGLRQPPPPEREATPAGRAGRHPDLGAAAWRPDRNGRSERRLPRGHRKVDVEIVVAAPAEARVGLQRDPEVEVAGRTAVSTRCALSGQTNQLAVAHSGGEVDVDITLIERQPAASSLQRVLQRELEQRLAVLASQRPAAAPARAAA